ncbi:MAG: hypothetical protein EBR86_14680 [Planctomycetia bacterium]|nr:hypothetical protein [Planctomycetia bacterium]
MTVLSAGVDRPWSGCVAVLGLIVCGAVGAGCSQATVKPKVIEIKVDPMVQVRSTLENYAKGQPLGSEVTGFDQMVANVKAVSAEKAAILGNGLAEIKKPGADVKGKSKALLTELGLGAEKP